MSETSSLQQAREAAGLTVEQISSLTNIPNAVIKGLENNSASDFKSSGEFSKFRELSVVA